MIKDIKKAKFQLGVITEAEKAQGESLISIIKKVLQNINVSYNDICCNDIFLGNIEGRDLLVTNRQITSYTLVLSDAGKLIEMNVGSANTLTIPPNEAVAFPIGTQIMIAEYGSGQTTITPGMGVTINSAGGKDKLTEQYSGASIIKIATNEWYLFGDITL